MHQYSPWHQLLCKKCPYSKFFCSALSRIQTFSPNARPEKTLNTNTFYSVNNFRYSAIPALCNQQTNTCSKLKKTLGKGLEFVNNKNTRTTSMTFTFSTLNRLIFAGQCFLMNYINLTNFILVFLFILVLLHFYLKSFNSFMSEVPII